jgi:uncharacterized membrane protein
MLELALAALAWIFLHLFLAGPLRGALVSRLGENGFRGLFSVLSMAGLVWLALAWRAAPTIPVFPGLPWVAALLMPWACILLLAGGRPDNPTSVLAEVAGGSELPIHGITRVTRHPVLWAFVLWALAHILAGGTLAGMLLCGAILLSALRGMWNIDAKRHRALGPAWEGFAALTSRIPFGAILAGRQRFVPSEIGWFPLLGGLILCAVLAWAHGFLFGVPAFPC